MVSLARAGRFGAEREAVSLISWNVLAPCYASGNALYGHVAPAALDWGSRVELIMEELLEADADLILLQEVMYDLFEELEARLVSVGYGAVMQRPKKKGEDHPTGNASFFRAERFSLSWADHRSRILLLGLRDSRCDAELCVANCHLEGDPRQPLARVAQLRSALLEAKRRGGQRHALVLAGDMNAPLISSAVASYLSFGSVLPGVVEFGWPVPVPEGQEDSFPYQMTSAYAPGAEFSFSLRGASGPCHMLDQVWFDATRFRCYAVRDVFRSEHHKLEVLSGGLPSQRDPSDHLPVGVILEVVDLPAKGAEEVEVTSEELLQQAEELWQACPLSAVQRQHLLSCEEELERLRPKGARPSPQQLEGFQAAQVAQKALLKSLPEESQQVLDRVAELRKQARKASRKVAKESGGRWGTKKYAEELFRSRGRIKGDDTFMIRCHLQDADPKVRLEALKAAILSAENGKHETISYILDRRVDDGDVAVRLLATSALAYLLDARDAEASAARAAGLRRFLDADYEVRHAARGLLAAVGCGNESVVSGLAAIVQDRQEDWLRQEAVEALAELAKRGSKEAIEAIVHGLGDPSLEVRREAVAALGDVAPFGDRDGTALLCECCTDPDPIVRCTLAHASTIISPWGDVEMTAALVGLLQDTHAEVRARAVDALGAVARPSNREVLEAVAACAQDSQERVRSAVKRSLALLSFPEVGKVQLPAPEPIEGVKSKKAQLLRPESQDLPSSVATLLNSKAFLCLSRSSRVVLEGALPLLDAAFDLLDSDAFWRHPRARFAAVSPSLVMQLAQENSNRTVREVLRFGFEYLAEDIEKHLSCFALPGAADATLADLTRCQKVLLTFAKAFWPRAPHVLFVYEPRALGLEGSSLEAVLAALSEWSGGVLLARAELGGLAPGWQHLRLGD
ncbi:unnamed protein product [Effrenium voratum]|nr:unnamed protein product [Effrenium voratum]